MQQNGWSGSLQEASSLLVVDEAHSEHGAQPEKGDVGDKDEHARPATHRKLLQHLLSGRFAEIPRPFFLPAYDASPALLLHVNTQSKARHGAMQLIAPFKGPAGDKRRSTVSYTVAGEVSWRTMPSLEER